MFSADFLLQHTFHCSPFSVMNGHKRGPDTLQGGEQKTELQKITNSGYFFDVYHSVTRTDPEVTVEAFQHGEPIAVDYVFATKEFTPLNVLQMPTVKSMRRTPLLIPGCEPSDHMYHLAELVI